MRNLSRTGPGRLIITACASLALTGASLSVAAFSSTTSAAAAPAAAAAPMHPAVSKTAIVVKERRRGHFGRILVTVHGAALYYLPRGSCTGLCLSVWPRLVMPAGKTKPRGANCLGTSRFGKHHRLQVTYRKHRLYTFVDDSGTSVTGNGVEGFKVAKVMRHC
jgi:predicted lipoprotein with Yx(FWY)xxD motif